MRIGPMIEAVPVRGVLLPFDFGQKRNRPRPQTVVSPAPERRTEPSNDRRRVQRGGRRALDRPGRYPTILIADCHDEIRAETARYLDECGFRVLRAADGVEALDLIQATPPHVILMELTLPRMPAWRLLSRVASQNIPVIVLNPAIVLAGAFEGKAVDPILCRPAGLLVKPCPLPMMREEIRRVLRRQASQDSAARDQPTPR